MRQESSLIRSDSQLVIIYAPSTRPRKNMKAYLKKTRELIMEFKEVKLKQVFKTKNNETDNLAKWSHLETLNFLNKC